MPALNAADALQLGGKAVSRAYLGAKQVWPLVTTAKATFTIDHTKVEADLTDFPVYLNLNDAPDLPVASGVRCYIDGMEAACEFLPEWNELHVKVPLLSSTVDTVITIDPSGPSSIASGEVWSNGYVSVYHFFNDNPTVFTQDSASGYDGVATTSTAVPTFGKIGIGLNLDGATTMSASTAGIVTGANPRTMSAWVYTDGGDNVTIWGQGLADIGTLFEMTRYNGNLIFHGYGGGFDTIAISAPIPDATVAYCCLTYDGTATKVYLDGNYMGEAAMTLDTGTAFNNLGGPGYFGQWSGVIDEARLSSEARSPEWIATEFANQNDPSTFYAVGSA